MGMNSRDPHDAAAVYNRLAREEGWQSVCHAALTFQRPELCEVLEIWHRLAKADRLPRRKDLTPRLLRAHLPNVALLRRYKEEYRVLVDGEFGLSALPENFARFAKGELLKPVLALE